MTATASDEGQYLGIADVAASTGLTQDTLRWYERERLFPPVDRGPDRRRRYTRRQVAFLALLVRLRRTGMPTKDMREFSRLVSGGAATHGRRLAVLAAHRRRILAKQAELEEDLVALDDKTEHYRQLIDQGLDCEGIPVDAETAVQQRATTDLDGEKFL